MFKTSIYSYNSPNFLIFLLVMPPKGVRARSANLKNLQKARDANPVNNSAAPAAPANLESAMVQYQQQLADMEAQVISLEARLESLMSSVLNSQSFWIMLRNTLRSWNLSLKLDELSIKISITSYRMSIVLDSVPV